MNQRFFSALLLIIVALAGLPLASRASHAMGWTGLAVRVECDNRAILVEPAEGAKIVYYWIHSVELTPIVEVYKVTPRGLVLVEGKARSFGAGHPYNAEELGGRFYITRDWLVYTANYTIGPSLRITGSKDYYRALYIVIPEGENFTLCAGFERASIEVAP